MDSLQHIWASRHGDAAAPPLDILMKRARTITRRAWLRDAIEYLAGLIVVATNANIAVQADDWFVRSGVALIILGVVVVMIGLWRRRAQPPVDASMPANGYLRQQLVQQRDMLASVPRWYLAPLVPGIVVLIAAVAAKLLSIAPAVWVLPPILVIFGLIAAAFAFIAWINRRAARKYDIEISALDASEQNPAKE